MRGLYPIVDVDTLSARGISLLPFAEQVLSAAPPLLQLRAKHATGRDTLAALRALRPLCHARGTLLFANDRPDLALLAECDGVHVGQDDLDLLDVRRIAPRLKVGISTHHPEQLQAALALRPDYVAYGPVYDTSSKLNPDAVVGVAGLSRAAESARAAGVPLVAIGGITLQRAPEIAATGALGAVIAALVPSTGNLAEAAERAQALQRALAG